MKCVLYLSLFLSFVRGIPLSCRLDFLFVIDASGSLVEEFSYLRRFLTEIGDQMDIDSGKHRVALLEYSGLSHRWPKSYFGEITTKEQFRRLINTMPHLKGTTATGEALKQAKSMLEARDVTPFTYLIVVSDGFSHDRVENPMKELKNIPNLETIATTVSDNVNMPELQIIAKNANIFTGPNALNSLKQRIRSLDCKPKQTVKIQEQPPVLHSKTTPKYENVTLPPVSGCELDLVLAFDLSSSVGKQWRKSVAQAKAVIRLLNEKATRIAAVCYASRAQMLFRLNSYKNSADMLKRLDYLSLMHGLTSAVPALRLSEQELLSGYGARTNANKVLIVFTDGFSFRDPSRDSEELRRRGVTIYAVGEESGPVYEEGLVEIAGASSRTVFDAQGFQDLLQHLKEYNNRC